MNINGKKLDKSILNGQRIILISPKFFKYQDSICDEIRCEGGFVHYYDERNNPSSMGKIILRKVPKLLKNKINTYYASITVKEKDFHPDFVIVISPETMTSYAVTKLKEAFIGAKFVLYMWDSIENKNAKNIYQLFDMCYSFDQKDCKKYGFTFRPLFFIPEYETLLLSPESIGKKRQINKAENIDKQYTLAFIGSVHSDRAKILYFLEQQCKKNNWNYYYYIYFPGKLMLNIRILFDKYLRKLDSNNFHTTALPISEVVKILENTNCVIDINHPKQIGLTMRTIEMLGQQKKIITTNSYVKEYDFYVPSNQIIINREKIEINGEDISKSFISTDFQVYEKYTLRYWLQEIIK
jgi:hypothetical protein